MKVEELNLSPGDIVSVLLDQYRYTVDYPLNSSTKKYKVRILKEYSTFYLAGVIDNDGHVMFNITLDKYDLVTHNTWKARRYGRH